MFHIHTSDKLYPKFIHKVFVHYQGDAEASVYETLEDEREPIFNCITRFYPIGEFYINLSIAKEITFNTYIFWKFKEGFTWLYLDEKLLKEVYSDEGQSLILKRSMNVPE